MGKLFGDKTVIIDDQTALDKLKNSHPTHGSGGEKLMERSGISVLTTAMGEHYNQKPPPGAGAFTKDVKYIGKAQGDTNMPDTDDRPRNQKIGCWVFMVVFGIAFITNILGLWTTGICISITQVQQFCF